MPTVLNGALMSPRRKKSSASAVVEDGRLEVGVGRQADADDGAAAADVLARLLEGLLGDGDEQDGVGAEAVRGRGLDLVDEVLARHKVDVRLGAELGAHLALLGAAVNGDRLEAHGLGILQRQRAEAAAGADNGDRLARARARLLEALVDGDACAEHGRDGLEVALLGDARHVRRLGDGVLLERAVDRVAREQRLGAQRLVGVEAVRAREAGSVEPLDAGVVANLDLADELATTMPAPSWPPTSGSFVSRGQSPIMACRSVWQTPEYLMLMSTSSGPGFWTGIFL
ncbi:hypothetical protein BN1708_000298 [Verticillium longisporum]|uniref:Uncharacterized protein n=1 Tax=Verticillium longisporum TaxID=100787 RepID=A0A0G4KCY4_VERLO|nr:hypothetical protein BN1708_000298 [Verticillium longisporum]